MPEHSFFGRSPLKDIGVPGAGKTRSAGFPVVDLISPPITLSDVELRYLNCGDSSPDFR